MNNQDFKQNMKLGAFVIGSVIVFLSTVFYLGSENNYFNKTYNVSAVFKNVEGLKNGDNIWLSGVKVGTVKNVQIISEGKVMVQLSLKENQNKFIKKDATAIIGSDGLIGNKIVIIRPGKDSQIIEDGDTINTFSPTDTQELFNIAKEVGTNTQSITEDFKLISARLNNGEGFLGELLNDGPISKELRATVSSLKSASENTNRVTAELGSTVKKLNNADGLVNKLFTDTSYVTTFEGALVNVGEVSTNAKEASEGLKSITSKLNDQNNALGVILADTSFANDLKVSMDNTKSATYKLDENMEAMQHNFLLRGYFKKQEKAAKKAKKD